MEPWYIYMISHMAFGCYDRLRVAAKSRLRGKRRAPTYTILSWYLPYIAKKGLGAPESDMRWQFRQIAIVFRREVLTLRIAAAVLVVCGSVILIALNR